MCAVPRRRPGAALVLLAALALLVPLAVLTLSGAQRAGAQEPSDLERQALSIERQLLCPQCTNERLDVCNIAICLDMKQEIRSQLRAGRNSDEIIFFFQNRYGQRVLAELPRSGFNLWLFGWVGVSMAITLLGGAFLLLRLRREGRAHRRALAGAGPDCDAAVDDRWLDDQLSGERP